MRFNFFKSKIPSNINLLVIAGDILEHGNPKESEEACLFLLDLQKNKVKDIVWILGNHDYYVSKNIEMFQEKYPTIIFKNYGSFIWAGLNFFTSGYTEFYNFNFANYYFNMEEEIKYMVPITVPDIIITHTPPSHPKYSESIHLGDVGSTALTSYLHREKIKYCFSGHLHATESKTTLRNVIINGCQCINVAEIPYILEI